MTTKLNDQQLNLMKKVRDKMYADYFADSDPMDFKFICHAICLVENGLNEFGKNSLSFRYLSEKEGSLSKELVQLIQAALDHSVTMEWYISSRKLSLSWGSIYTGISALARLAWLDRMIETRVLT
jgi:hypothetical protein